VNSLTLAQSERSDAAWLDVLAVAGMVALGAQIRIPLPFSPVPVTLQTLAVLAAPFLVGSSRATMGMLLYAALGLLGAPVFALSFGPTFGFVLGFIAAPALIARFKPAYGLLAGSTAIYGLGMLWLSLWGHFSLGQAFLLGVAPFLFGDALKAALVYRLARRS
jgi:biotin transport system substrate-specific component